LYFLDKNANLRFSHENPDVQKLYEGFPDKRCHIRHIRFYILSTKNWSKENRRVFNWIWRLSCLFALPSIFKKPPQRRVFWFGFGCSSNKSKPLHPILIRKGLKPAGARIFSRAMDRKGANDKYRSVQADVEKGLVYETISCATV